MSVAQLELYSESTLEELTLEEKWKLLLQQPDLFFDSRSTKRNPRAPDFKSKDRVRDIALWLNDCPENLSEQVKNLQPF